MKKIVLTGGGTAGHVTPNIALVPKLKESGFEIKYIGTYNGMEKQLVEDAGDSGAFFAQPDMINGIEIGDARITICVFFILYLSFSIF